ncbi:MAG: transposase [Deltaproteobacteria bacterium]|nr:transposase [Deltaproteobacteria bacterium]
MPRGTRIRFQNAWYHIMNRGAARQPVFKSEVHYELFLEIMAEVSAVHGIEFHSYCLMGNHFHLLVRTPEDGLSEGMRDLIGLYTRKFNKMEKRDGPLFRGRYKSIVIDADSYLVELSRYIHNNPIKAKIVSMPESV